MNEFYASFSFYWVVRLIKFHSNSDVISFPISPPRRSRARLLQDCKTVVVVLCASSKVVCD